jgi:hypothetical protein
MADIDDRWYRTDRETGARVPTARHGSGRRWDARWHDGERQRHKAFTRKADAVSFLAKVTTDLERGAYVDPRAGRVTVAAYGAQCVASSCTGTQPPSSSSGRSGCTSTR